MAAHLPLGGTAHEQPGDLRLSLHLHGRGRVPGHQLLAFDLIAFVRALEQWDVGYQLSRYAPDAEVRIITPDSPPSAPQTLHGRAEIDAWLVHASTRDLGLEVTHLVDGGDQVAFTQRWHHDDGTSAVATSTAEIEDGLITRRQTILVWDHDRL
jgi:hypothetical protein